MDQHDRGSFVTHLSKLQAQAAAEPQKSLFQSGHGLNQMILIQKKRAGGLDGLPAHGVLTPRKSLFLGEIRIDLNKALPLLGDFVFHEDRIHRTLRLAQSAVDTLIRVDVKLISRFMDAVYRADGYAGFIFHPDAGFSDDVRHSKFLLRI